MNSPVTQEKDFVLLYVLLDNVFTTPLQFFDVAEVAPNVVPCAAAAAGETVARLP